MRNQRGFAYLEVGMALAIGVLAFLLWAQTQRLDIAHDQLDNCRENVDKWAKSVIKQNKAVKDLQKDAEKRARIAKAALAKARQGVGSLTAEIARLRAAKPADCAGAVAAVRDGLKP